MAAIGQIIDDKYEILKLIGQGGMSRVYLAMDKRLNKQWAVKEIEKRARDRNNEVVIQSAIAEANMMGVAAGLSTMGYVPFVSSFAMFAAGRAFEVQGVLDDWLHILRPRRRMQELVRRLKNHGYSVYYLSNIPEDVLALLKERGVLDRFDGGVASCEVHINKPDPRIYQALLDKYHLRADECIFIDDRAENLVAASALGFGIYEMHNVGTLLRSLPTFGVSLH